jgi:anti-sigma B factor antagonist
MTRTIPAAPAVDSGRQSCTPVGCTCPTIEVNVQGELDAATIPRLRERLSDALSLQPVHLYVDLSDCTFIGAAGVTMLLDAHCKTRRQRGTLVLRGCAPRHLRVLALMGLNDVFDVEGGAPCS